MATFLFNKLVRDKVLERCLEDPKVRTDYRILDTSELKDELIAKIHEETNEIPVREVSDEEIISELADVQAVVDALRDAYGISPEQLATAKFKKFEKNGGFEKKAYIASVDLDEESDWNEIFRSQPDKYIEIKN